MSHTIEQIKDHILELKESHASEAEIKKVEDELKAEEVKKAIEVVKILRGDYPILISEMIAIQTLITVAEQSFSHAESPLSSLTAEVAAKEYEEILAELLHNVSEDTIDLFQFKGENENPFHKIYVEVMRRFLARHQSRLPSEMAIIKAWNEYSCHKQITSLTWIMTFDQFKDAIHSIIEGKT